MTATAVPNIVDQLDAYEAHLAVLEHYAPRLEKIWRERARQTERVNLAYLTTEALFGLEFDWPDDPDLRNRALKSTFDLLDRENILAAFWVAEAWMSADMTVERPSRDSKRQEVLLVTAATRAGYLSTAVVRIARSNGKKYLAGGIDFDKFDHLHLIHDAERVKQGRIGIFLGSLIERSARHALGAKTG